MLTTGKNRVKTLNKFLKLCALTLDSFRPLTVYEIAEEIHCSIGHAYNYRKALEEIVKMIFA